MTKCFDLILTKHITEQNMLKACKEWDTTRFVLFVHTCMLNKSQHSMRHLHCHPSTMNEPPSDCYTSTICIIITICFTCRNMASMSRWYIWTLLFYFSCRMHATFKISTARWVLLSKGWCATVRGGVVLVEGGLGIGTWPHSHTPIAEPICLLALHLNIVSYRQHPVLPHTTCCWNVGISVDKTMRVIHHTGH